MKIIRKSGGPRSSSIWAM